MIHDPLCKLPNEWETFLDVDGHRTIRRRCYCEMIAKARADEREQAAQRIEALEPESFACACMNAPYRMRGACAAAARGEAS
jgi:hypothetical protein